ncbi:type II 3-dehydroquinate dehydratase [Ignatzschineria cameli]|uniref:3-dehydroquinate dehydratase n=1 Tax=Ignatzschineria cameli TaxID=2182793 RepID=A0A2U2AJD9_9GAMM|nr:type II 3-dehydroquinate dehydratase [Ignatzschineria cameli]PWD89514.1 type II 3-dehydroquinate dehydratase [Ignatzschineria cameli]PWD90986.1 type II 3-dehydroquinate dehydratase [Ignatzschineria cameli]PWD91774.1 type II 3-dehydroquinate dehydratase [Ignatzschineria cameli]
MNQEKHKKILLINGVNLNLLGMREPEIYGSATLEMLESHLVKCGKACKIDLITMQSNREYEIVETIHAAKQNNIEGIIINPGAFTHTSIAIRDAFLGVEIPFVEIHISNVFRRESFRHTSYLSDIASGVIVGCGLYGYELALLNITNIISNK